MSDEANRFREVGASALKEVGSHGRSSRGCVDEVRLPKLGSFHEQRKSHRTTSSSFINRDYYTQFWHPKPLIYNIRKPLFSFPNHPDWYKSRQSMKLQREDRSCSSESLPRL